MSVTAEIRELYDLTQKHCFRYGDFTLASGLPSRYYYDGKKVTLSPRGALLVGKVLLPLIRACGAQAVGGLSIGADPIATAIAICSAMENDPVPAFIVRPEAKGHGTRDQVAQAHGINGELLAPGRRVAIVDDVITTGGTVDKAVAAVTDLGCQVVAVVALVERHEGGAQRLRERFPVYRLFYTDADGKLYIDEATVAAIERLSVQGAAGG